MKKSKKPNLPTAIETREQKFRTSGGEPENKLRAFDWSATALGYDNTWPEGLQFLYKMLMTSIQPAFFCWGEERLICFNKEFGQLVNINPSQALGMPASQVFQSQNDGLPSSLFEAISKNDKGSITTQQFILTNGQEVEEKWFTFSGTTIPGNTTTAFYTGTDITEAVFKERQLNLISRLSNLEIKENFYQIVCDSFASLIADSPDFAFSLIYEKDRLQQEYKLISSAGIKAEKHWPALSADQKEIVFLDNLNDLLQIPKGSQSLPSDKGYFFQIEFHSSKLGFLLALSPYRKNSPDLSNFIKTIQRLLHASLQEYYRKHGSKVSRNKISDIEEKYFSNDHKKDLKKKLITANSAIRETESLIHELFMQTPAYITLLRGPEFIFELCNDMYMQLIGKDRDVIGKTLAEGLPEVVGQGFIEILDKVYKTGEPFIGNELPTKIDRLGNGKLDERYLNFIYQPFRDVEGNIQGIFAHGVDATEQVLARRKIAESEEKYRGVFETMDQGFCILEMIFDENKKPVDYTFLECNPTFGKQTGLKDPEGKTARELVPNLEDTWFELYGNVALTGKPMRFTEGSEAMGRWFDVYAFRIGDSTSRKVALLFTDITERRKSEEQLRYHATISKNIADAVISTDLNHIIKSWNNGAEKLYGWKAEEVIGKKSGEVIPTVLLNTEQYGHWQKMLDTQGYWAGEVVQTRRDGSKLPVFASVAYVKDEKGDPVAAVAVNRDITQQKKAEKALRDSEQRFKMYAEAMPQMAFIADPEGNIIYYNQRWYSFIGIEKGTEGWGWKNFNIHHPDDLDRTIKRWKESLESGKSYECEYRLRRKDGEYRWHLGRAEPVRDAEGKIEMWLGTNTDIHVQKEAVEALRKSEEYYKTMTDNTPVITWVSDAAGKFIFLNRQWYDFTGQNADEALDEGWLNAVHPEDRKKTVEVFTASNKNQIPFRLEYRLRMKDGEFNWHLFTGLPKFDNGKYEGFVGAVIDIHERKIAEQMLQDSEEFSRTLLESSPDCVKALDVEGRLLSINPPGLQMLEIDDFEKYKNTEWLNFWRGDYYENAKEALSQAKIGQVGHFSGSKPTFKGNKKWWDVLVAPVFGTDGKVKHLVSVSRDITKLKELEQQKDDFLGIASHELKTPVTSIKAYTQVLQAKFQEAQDTQAATMLSKMDGQLNKLTGLISDLLDVTKVEQGKLQLRKETIAINNVIIEVAEEIQRTTKKHTIYLALDKNVNTYADKDRIGQVITNLLTNGIKYSPKADKIIIKTELLKEEILISVQDFGVGLSEADCQKVFERFYRVEGSGYETFPGLGLGLYISSEIIHRHFGDIWVESKKGEGSRFCFTLPIK